MRPTIAAVIPAYNAEKTIETTILSALHQTEPPEEVIVVDDGSTDGTTTVVENIGYPVSLIRQENQGAAVARQTGTIATTADYIAYLDADDWWPENKIARCREIIAKEDVDFMLADLQRARPGDGPKDFWPRNSSFYPWAKSYFNGREVNSGIDNLFKLDKGSALSLLLNGFQVNPPTMLVKRNVIEAVGGWDSRFRRCQDFDIGLRIVRHFSMYYLYEVQAIVGVHAGNVDGYAYVVKQTEGDIKVLLAHLDIEIPSDPYYHQVAMALGRKYRGLGYSHRKMKQYTLARQNYAKAFGWPGYRAHAMIRWVLLCPISFFYCQKKLSVK